MIRKGQACESATGTGSGLLHRFVLGTFGIDVCLKSKAKWVRYPFCDKCNKGVQRSPFTSHFSNAL